MGEARRVVLLSTANYDSAVWTNKQHLASGLAATRDVAYIESMGLRRPSFRLADLRRIAAKVAPGLKDPDAPAAGGNRVRPPRLRVVSPTVLPFHSSALVRAVNNGLVSRDLVARTGIDRDSVLWTFSPLDYGLSARAGATVYHSVDLLHTFPRMPTRALLEAERRLLAAADVVIASSAGVEAHLRAQGRNDVVRWENVASVERFAPTGRPRLPRAIFAGNLTPAKVDFSLLRAVADRGIELALAGPVAVDGTRAQADVADLLRRSNVSYLGNLGLDELGREVATSTVGLIPYRIDPHTAGIFPMKVYEYLAAGLPVISTALPSLTERPIEGLEVVGGEPAAFADRVAAARACFSDAGAQRRQAAARPHSWSGRIEAANRLLDGLSLRPELGDRSQSLVEA